MHASVLSQADRANDGHQIDDATVWQASDFPDDRRYVLALDAQMAAEIVAQARRGLADGLTPDTVTSENFALPLCAAVLARAYTQVEHAPGFSLVSGFPVTQLKEPELRLAYAGFLQLLWQHHDTKS